MKASTKLKMIITCFLIWFGLAMIFSPAFFEGGEWQKPFLINIIACLVIPGIIATVVNTKP